MSKITQTLDEEDWKKSVIDRFMFEVFTLQRGTFVSGIKHGGGNVMVRSSFEKWEIRIG